MLQLSHMDIGKTVREMEGESGLIPGIGGCPQDVLLLWAKVMQPVYFKYYSMDFYCHEKS